MALDWAYSEERRRSFDKTSLGLPHGGEKEEGEAKGDVGSSGEAGILTGNRTEFRQGGGVRSGPTTMETSSGRRASRHGFSRLSK